MMMSENGLIKKYSYARNAFCHAIVAKGKNWYFLFVQRQCIIHIQILTMVGIIFFQTESHSRKKLFLSKNCCFQHSSMCHIRSRQNFARLESN